MKKIYDHTEPNWLLRYQTHKRENGAATYSRDLVKYQVPLWEHDNIIISTCPLLLSVDDLPKETDLVVQYLHTYAYGKPLGDPIRVIRCIKTKYKNIVFVTSYNSFNVHMQQNGINSVFIPMTIDKNAVLKNTRKIKKEPNTVLYFGNITEDKENVYKQLRSRFTRRGWRFNTISYGKFNGLPITDPDMWELIQMHEYGIGVGRCALEMLAFGLKVMVAGMEFGGLIVNDTDFEAQTLTNFNGRVVTFDRDINHCIDNFDASIVRTNDIHDRLPEIKQTIESVLSGRRKS